MPIDKFSQTPPSKQPDAYPLWATELIQRGRQLISKTSEPAPTPWLRATVLGVSAGLSVGFLVTAVVSAVAGYFARVVVTPVKEHVDNLEILAVVPGVDGDEVILPATPETIVDGCYGFYFEGGTGFARIGEITSFSPRDKTLSRRVEFVEGLDLAAGRRGWWSSMTHRSPAEAGFEAEDVTVQLPGGGAPAWYVPAPDGERALGHRRVWAIMVHGRGAIRAEGLKALPSAHRLGMNVLLMSYRNDGEAPAAADGRYGLGVTEWEDIEAGIRYAREHDADEVVLFGWSMGGAITLQVLARSPEAEVVRALVLTAPVIDWTDVLAYQARALKIPEPVGRLTRWFISSPVGRRFTGLAAPVDLKALNWIDRADQLHTRTLILHSLDDNVVPYGPSRLLSQINSLVSFVPFTHARHVKEWNHKSARWEKAVEGWLHDLYNEPEPGSTQNSTSTPQKVLER